MSRVCFALLALCAIQLTFAAWAPTSRVDCAAITESLQTCIKGSMNSGEAYSCAFPLRVATASSGFQAYGDRSTLDSLDIDSKFTCSDSNDGLITQNEGVLAEAIDWDSETGAFEVAFGSLETESTIVSCEIQVLVNNASSQYVCGSAAFLYAVNPNPTIIRKSDDINFGDVPLKDPTEAPGYNGKKRLSTQAKAAMGILIPTIAGLAVLAVIMAYVIIKRRRAAAQPAAYTAFSDANVQSRM